MAIQPEVNSNGHPWFTDSPTGSAGYRVMYRLLDADDVEFLRLHGVNTWKFRRYRSWLFLRYLNALSRDIEACFRVRLQHEHWDMLQIAQEKLWTGARIWKLRLKAAAFAMGLPTSGLEQQLTPLIQLATVSQRSSRR